MSHVHGVGLTRFALLKRFADAEDDFEARRESRADLLIDQHVAFADDMAAFAVADEDGFDAQVSELRQADFAGERAVGLVVEVLSL